MIATCVCCGFDGHVHDYHLWTADGRKYPDVWLCDVCYVEVLV